MTTTDLIAEALARYPFRRRGPFESVAAYRDAVIAHVETRDYALAHELRTGRRQADWTPDDVDDFERRLLHDRGARRREAPSHEALWVTLPDRVAIVSEATLINLAHGGLTATADRLREDPDAVPPILATLLLIDGRVLCTSVSRGDRIAIIRAAARTRPVFGFFVVADVFIHAINASKTAGKCEAIVAHVGTRDMRRMLTRPYRRTPAGIVFDPPRPDVDKRGPETIDDPYAGIFAVASPQVPQ